METGGKQYKVQAGDVLYVEKLNVAEGENVIFDHVLVVAKEDGFVTGTPLVTGAKVTAKVNEHGKGTKIVVYKYKPKKNYRRKQGHRQPYTKVTVENIQV